MGIFEKKNDHLKKYFIIKVKMWIVNVNNSLPFRAKPKVMFLRSRLRLVKINVLIFLLLP